MSLFYWLGQELPEWPEEVRRHLPTWNGVRCTEGDHEYSIHAPVLYDLTVALSAQAVLELGTRHCQSARIFIEALKRTGGHLWTMDCVDYAIAGQLGADLMPYVTPVIADDRTAVWDRMVEVLYIDSSHVYEHTLQEMDKYWPFVNTPGVMILADTDAHWGQKRAVNEWAERRQIGYVLDTRAQGMAYFIKPEYPYQYRDRAGSDMWTRTPTPS